MNPFKTISDIFSTYWFRIGSILLAGILIRMIIAVSYAIFAPENGLAELSMFPSSLLDYALFTATAGIGLELLRWLNQRLERRLPWKANPNKRFFCQLGIATPLTVLFTTLMMFTLSAFVYRAPVYLLWKWNLILPQLILVNVSILAVTIALIGLELGMFLARQWRDSLVEVERFKKDSLEARFQLLKNQINPHFLFNTLNTLSSLIHIDQDAAATFVRQLAKVYRAVLDHHEKEVIDVATELAILQAYRYLVETRFQDKLRITLDIPEPLHTRGIPPLTLQLLIENALKHNIIAQQRPLTIRIFTENDAYLVVENTLQPKIGGEDSPKIGLKNLISRYAYMTDQPVIIMPTDTTFIVKIPLLPTAEMPARFFADRQIEKESPA